MCDPEEKPLPEEHAKPDAAAEGVPPPKAVAPTGAEDGPTHQVLPTAEAEAPLGSTIKQVRAGAGPPKPAPDLVRPIARFLYCNNPFYVISACLIFWGLWSSFRTDGKTFQTCALMIGLAGYTLLLAASAWFLVWIGQVWNDVRTILLLVVLMLLAMSVTFDQALAQDPSAGKWYFIGGLFFSLAVSEGLFRGLPLRLRAGFRIPYYLLLGLFFLYPVALSPWIRTPFSPVLEWGLFAFSGCAGLIFLTLLPAVNRGPAYVRNNGSPWRWPLYPWVLFGTLAFGVCGRAFYLCYDLHGVNRSAIIFKPYFLVTFLLAINILLLQIGRRSHLKTVMGVALAMPAVLAALAITPNPARAVDWGFLENFTRTLGMSPLCLTLWAATFYYAVCLILRVAGASWGFSAALVALAFVRPEKFNLDAFEAPQILPILAVIALQLVLCTVYRRSWHAVAAAGSLCLAVYVLSWDTPWAPYAGLASWNILGACFLLVGIFYHDPTAKFLRRLGALWILVSVLGTLQDSPPLPRNLSPWIGYAYGFALLIAAAAYAYWMRVQLYFWSAGAGALSWIGKVGVQTYCLLKCYVSGLHLIAWGAVFFFVALAISLHKANLPQRWREGRRGGFPPSRGT
jgi:hypothetical protein